MREILFKGKAISTNRWIYGGFFVMDGRYFIIESNINKNCPYGVYEVYPESFGQYTGQTDSHGTKIFERDSVSVRAEDELATVCWDESSGRFILQFDGWSLDFDSVYGYECEVCDIDC